MPNITPTLQDWDKVKAAIALVFGGIGETGKTVTVAIRRMSDDLWLQNGAGSWGAGFDTNNMVEIDAVNLPGRYEYEIPAGQLSYTAVGYRVHIVEATLSVVEDPEIVLKRDGAIQSDILSDATPFPGANVDAAVSSRSSHSPGDVDTTLSATHGAASWEGATAGDIDTQLSGTHGAGSWEASVSTVSVPQSLSAVKDRPLRVQVVDPAGTTGLVLGDFAILAALGSEALSDPETDLGLTLDEVDDVEAPGYYELSLTSTEIGLLFLRLTRGADVFEFSVQVLHEGIDLIGQELYGAEGDLTVTAEDVGGVVEGATVRIYSGITLVARGTTDAAGQVTFGLPVGTYQVRVSKTGHDFSDSSPTTVTVVSNDNVAPRLDGILPTQASLGDQIVVYGRFFGITEVEVVFGTEVVAIDNVNSEGTIAMVTVPLTLTDTVIPVRVRKPDPATPPSGKLVSGIVTLEII